MSWEDPAGGAAEQLSLLRAARRPAAPRPVPEIASQDPVARVALGLEPAHLDRPFDYAVPAPMAQEAVPGARVRVRFAGRDVDGFVLERLPRSEHAGRLAPLLRVVSAEPVLTPDVFALARAVADRYAGTLGDVLRLAVPPRHAAAEKAAPRAALAVPPLPGAAARSTAASSAWIGYPAGPAFLARVAAGEGPRAVWTALPGPHWADAVAESVEAALAGGRGALVVVPDTRDVDLVDAAVRHRLGPDRHVRLEAHPGPAARYTAFLRLLRGDAQVAIGTRAASFAPVRDPGLLVLWDDGDEVHAEPRAPYPHAREVLRLRAEQCGAAVLFGGWSRTAEEAALVAAGWARELEPDRAVRRRTWPRVVTGTDDRVDAHPAATAARIPPAAWRAVQDGLRRGSVLLQVPRTGYLPGVACTTCRRPARCPHCAGPVVLGGHGSADGQVCGWCARSQVGWACPHCSGRRLRATATGVERTAEEIGRAFPGATVVVSRAEARGARPRHTGVTLPSVPPTGAIVLATPGLEPFAPGGYAAAVLLDGDALLVRPDLRAAEEALRRWRAAAALVRPAEDGGLVVVVADPSAAAVQALVRGDPAGHAARELAERAELSLPPAAAVASVTGGPQAVAALLAAAWLPEGASLFGPVPVPPPVGPPGASGRPGRADEPSVRTLVRAPVERTGELAAALHAALAIRSARKEPGTVRVRMDPRDLG